MPQGPPENVKPMLSYSTYPKTPTDVSYALKSHFQGYITWPGIDEFISSLPVMLQQATRLYHEEGRTREEVAEVMGCSVSSVNIYLRIVREMILLLRLHS